jgi:hypothetical protein
MIDLEWFVVPYSKVLTVDGQSVSLSWYQANIWDPRTIFLLLPWKLFSEIRGFPLVERPP